MTKATKTSWNYVWVKDKAGNEFACPMEDIKNHSELSDEEKSACVGDATRGSVGD